jgi:hypothetical protein
MDLMISKYRRLFDPLDIEILERAFDGNWTAVVDNKLVATNAPNYQNR